jgi:phage terminase large subunit-like protein
MFFCCKCCVLSGRGLCDELITRPQKSYWLRCVVVCDLVNLKDEEAMARVGPQRHRKNNETNTDNTIEQPVNWNHFQTIHKIPEQHTGKHGIKELQKSVTICTVHIIRKV